MNVRRVFCDRLEFADGAILEMVIWQVPQPVHRCAHQLKYSFFYGRPGLRLISDDNDRGKGNHRHIDGRQEACYSTTPKNLVADFLSDARRFRGEP